MAKSTGATVHVFVVNVPKMEDGSARHQNVTTGSHGQHQLLTVFHFACIELIGGLGAT
jgi:hypothetical protein